MFKKISVIKKAISNRIFRKRKSTIIILSGPSAIGKSTVAALLLKNFPDMQKVITATSRKPRSYEKADYIFLKEKQFKKKVLIFPSLWFLLWYFKKGIHEGEKKFSLYFIGIRPIDNR